MIWMTQDLSNKHIKCFEILNDIHAKIMKTNMNSSILLNIQYYTIMYINYPGVD